MPMDGSCVLQPIADGKGYRVAFAPSQGRCRDRSINGRGVGGVSGVIHRNLLDNQVEGVPGKDWGTYSAFSCECRPSPQIQAGDYSASDYSLNEVPASDTLRICPANSAPNRPGAAGASFR